MHVSITCQSARVHYFGIYGFLMYAVTIFLNSNFFQCGRSFDPHFLFTWPTAWIAMDTAEGMADICCAEVIVRIHSFVLGVNVYLRHAENKMYRV